MENIKAKRLITELEKRPALWDSTCDEYSSRALRIQCWDEIVHIFGDEGLNTLEKKHLESQVQRKWKSMRCCFVRELQRKKLIKTGRVKGFHKNEYVHYKRLLFARYKINIDSTNPDPERPIMKRQRAKKSKEQIRISSENEPIIEILETFPEKKKKKYENDEMNEDKLFLLSLLGPLRKIPIRRKMETKIAMTTLINDAIFEDCRLQLSTSPESSQEM